jgi:DNA-binding XRE family transcriptional regulator
MTHVVIVTDRSEVEHAWHSLCVQLGASVVDVLRPELCAANMTPGRPILIDAASKAYDEDELLAQTSLARALGSPVGVVLPSSTFAAIEELLEDICARRVAHREEEVSRVVSSLVRSVPTRARFEYLTVSPRSAALLGVLGDGTALHLPRPCSDEDDDTDVISIVIADDAASATVELASGVRFVLHAGDVFMESRPPTMSTAGQIVAPTQALALSSIDGTKLGARVRELRVAAGLTQAELARRTGIHRPNIARVEAGRHTPSLETLARLAAAIGVPTASVLEIG